MVYTVTLNPALDCYLAPETFCIGQINRYGASRFLPGGKGVNVSLMLSSLGGSTSALGIAAGFTGKALADMLEQAGCHTSFLFLKQGLTRLNLKLSPAGQPETALNGAGPALDETTLEQLEQLVATLLRPGDMLVLSGSLPQGLPVDTYARLAKAAPQGTGLVLDASGPALLAGLQAQPFLVKPNLEELGELFRVRLTGEEDSLPYARKLRRRGARNVLVSMGGQGAFLLTAQGKVLRRPALPGKEVSSVGAGDSMVAGFLHGWLQTRNLSAALDWGVSAGAATAFTQGLAEAGQVRQLYARHFPTRPGTPQC